MSAEFRLLKKRVSHGQAKKETWIVKIWRYHLIDKTSTIFAGMKHRNIEKLKSKRRKTLSPEKY